MDTKIKLRGKIKDSGVWVYWNVFGEIVSKYSNKRKALEIKNGAKTSFYHHIHQIKDMIISQSVGRILLAKDRNGGDVYEGDIVYMHSYGNATAIIEYTDDNVGSCGCCYPEFAGEGFVGRTLYCKDEKFLSDRVRLYDEDIEVIGNKWDTPELLEKHKNVDN